MILRKLEVFPSSPSWACTQDATKILPIAAMCGPSSQRITLKGKPKGPKKPKYKITLP